jgi:hypothetical protein
MSHGIHQLQKGEISQVKTNPFRSLCLASIFGLRLEKNAATAWAAGGYQSLPGDMRAIMNTAEYNIMMNTAEYNIRV